MHRFHHDELPIDLPLVRRLVDGAVPELADEVLAVAPSSGSSNALFRLGDDKLVRLPRQPGGGATIVKEARWLPYVDARTTATVPTHLRLGEPALGYPEHWAITTWTDGRHPSPRRAGARSEPRHGLAGDLARFVAELRSMEVPPEAAADETLRSYRGLPLASLEADFREAVDECGRLDLGMDLDRVLGVWQDALEASRSADATPRWFHGDLLAENLLTDGASRLTAVLDFGGLSIGDPTVDLVVAWEVLDDAARRELRRALEVYDATWTASRGWALFIALITFPYYGATMPGRCRDRLAMAQAAVSGP